MKEINDKQLKAGMNALFDEILKSSSKENIKRAIAKAVNLGMLYQETKIKQGIDIVFNELHNKNI